MSQIQPQKPVRQREGRPVKDKAHLARVAALGCLVCGSRPVEVHHLLRTGEHGMGRKSGDNWAVPLCREHHAHLHIIKGNEDDFFRLQLGDADAGRKYARKLWEGSNG